MHTIIVIQNVNHSKNLLLYFVTEFHRPGGGAFSQMQHCKESTDRRTSSCGFVTLSFTSSESIIRRKLVARNQIMIAASCITASHVTCGGTPCITAVTGRHDVMTWSFTRACTYTVYMTYNMRIHVLAPYKGMSEGYVTLRHAHTLTDKSRAVACVWTNMYMYVLHLHVCTLTATSLPSRHYPIGNTAQYHARPLHSADT